MNNKKVIKIKDMNCFKIDSARKMRIVTAKTLVIEIKNDKQII